ncbi:MAG: EAL domain-containing protein, partial [Rickettsiales bacterium]|nr:EAL domain-containing protein [Rickettsiales bacterium]
ARRLVVEITETAAQRDLRQTAYFVAALQSLGCKVALDDFGAGYTSFRQLKSLSVDIVKIDGSYIRNLTANSENQLFIKTLLDFNHSYGLKTVAECVESGDVAKMLMDMHVDYMQGYYFGKVELQPPWKTEPSQELGGNS